MDFETILSVVFIVLLVVSIVCFLAFVRGVDFWIVLALVSILLLWRPTVRFIAKLLFESHYKEGKIRNALLRFYIRHLDKRVDDRLEEEKGRPKPIGHLKLFISSDEYEIFEREEDGRYFARPRKQGSVYEDIFISHEYPYSSMRDLEDAKTRHIADYHGKVIGEDRYVYFLSCCNLFVLG